jgi:NADH dehydrogenase [ubiquinone] 1 alpha subcomplex assembly factor 6
VLSLEDLRSQVRAGDFEGYLCGNFMPTGARDAYFALRALNIELAQVRDATKGNAAMARVRMAFWRDVVDRAFQGAGAGGEGAAAAAAGPPSPVTSHPLFQSLRAAVHRHGLTRRWVERMIDAREADTDGVAPKTTDELAQYGERTSGSLLFLSLESIGVRDGRADEAAAAVGRALGLCTALRALPVHARLGQRYIPDEVMERVRGGRSGVLPEQSSVHPPIPHSPSPPPSPLAPPPPSAAQPHRGGALHPPGRGDDRGGDAAP